MIANDDELAAEVVRAGEETGELTWRLPLHPEFKELMKGTVADLSNLAKREGGDDHRRLLPRGVRRRDALGARRHRRHRLGVGREYTGKDASGFGVRLLIELARHHAS